MEPKRQTVQMAEGAQACFADGALRDLGEHGVPQLAESLGQHPGHAVADQQGDRHDDHRVHGRGDRIDRVLVDNGDGDRDSLGRRQEDQRDHHAHTHLGGVLGPQIGQQRADGL